MEEIDLKDLFNYFKSKLILIIGITLLFVVVGFVYGNFIKTPEYKSYTTILLTKESGQTITSTDITLNRNLVDTYSEIIKSKNVLGTVIKRLKLDTSYEALSKSVSVEAINDTEIIKVTVVNENKKVAKDTANEIADVFSEKVVKLYDISNLGIIDDAELAKNPYNINVLKDTILFTLIGIVLSFALVFVLYYFDTTIKTVADVEKIGLPVIGAVPTVGGKKNE